jgi:hypothetical protein
MPSWLTAGQFSIMDAADSWHLIVGKSGRFAPVRLIHGLKFVRPRQQDLSLSFGLGCLDIEILGRRPIRTS